MNNAAIICEIKNVRPHPNANKVQLGTACGYQVVIGLDVQENDLGIYFPTDTCLGKDYAEINQDLLTYFGKNLRVRTQVFRGERSEGFWAGWETIPDTFAGIDSNLEPGTEVTTYLDCEICKKYVNSKTLAAKNRDQSKLAKVLRSGSLPTFQKHVETSHLRKEWEALQNKKDRPWIWTIKEHGCSGRIGYVLVPKDISFCTTKTENFRNKIKNLFRKYDKKELGNKLAGEILDKAQRLDTWLLKQWKKLPLQQSEYKFLVGSRNVILSDKKQDSWYPEDFRYKAAKPFEGNLHKGEVVYFEIVGYAGPDTPIMARHIAEHKNIKDQYGKTITYTYGCKEGEFDIYVYRIAYQTEDGQSIDLTWDQVKARCKELGVKHVLEINDTPFVWDSSIPLNFIQSYIERPDPIDSRHPMEGVVLRIDGSKPEFYKEKSFTFRVLEGLAIDQGAIDIEEAN